MSRNVTNMAASVHARLKNEARAAGRPFNEMLHYYAMERFLYRLAQSAHAERFILKGALLLRSFDAAATRPTRDIDLLGHGDSSADHLVSVVRDCCRVAVEDDGMRFDPDSVSGRDIRPEAPYDGCRIKFKGYLGTARVPMQVDVGFGDVVVPGPIWIEYPELLDLGSPHVKAYSLETAVAEKFQAMVDLGEMNSRMKDYYDLWWLSEHKAFDGARLAEAVRATFSRRKTALPATDPVGLTGEFASEDSQAQWKAFTRRTRLQDTAPALPQVIEAARAFLMPPTQAITKDRSFDKHWPAGGPWTSSS